MSDGFHKINGLKWARAIARPSCIPKSRPKGIRAEGLRYEKALAKHIPFAKHGPWFEFEDASGRHFCQMDFVFGHGGESWVLEAKLSACESGFRQLHYLYLPVLEAVFDRPAHGIQVVKYLRRGVDGTICHNLAAALEHGLTDARTFWIWMPQQGTTGAAIPRATSRRLDTAAVVA